MGTLIKVDFVAKIVLPSSFEFYPHGSIEPLQVASLPFRDRFYYLSIIVDKRRMYFEGISLEDMKDMAHSFSKCHLNVWWNLYQYSKASDALIDIDGSESIGLLEELL